MVDEEATVVNVIVATAAAAATRTARVLLVFPFPIVDDILRPLRIYRVG
jgi:hypothetical protein